MNIPTKMAKQKQIQNVYNQRWGKQNVRHTLISLSASAQITCTFNCLIKSIL